MCDLFTGAEWCVCPVPCGCTVTNEDVVCPPPPHDLCYMTSQLRHRIHRRRHWHYCFLSSAESTGLLVVKNRNTYIVLSQRW